MIVLLDTQPIKKGLYKTDLLTSTLLTPQIEDENDVNYAALDFSARRKRKIGKKLVETTIEEDIYSQIKLNTNTTQ